MAEAEHSSSVLSFLCPPELRAAIEKQAAEEGLSNSAVARRACLQQLLRDGQRELGKD